MRFCAAPLAAPLTLLFVFLHVQHDVARAEFVEVGVMDADATGDRLGSDVDIDGDHAIIGA